MPDGLRQYTPSDLEPLARLLGEARAWPPSTEGSPSELAYRWARRQILPEDHVFVVQGAGGLVAYMQAAPSGDGSPRLSVDIAVLPALRRRGLGSALLGVAEERAAVYASRRLTAPVVVRLDEPDPPGALFLKSRGFRTDSGYWHMRLDNIGRHTLAEWPDGIIVRTATETPQDAETWSNIVEHSFREITPAQAVLAQMREPGASPDGYFFAIDKERSREIGTSRARIDTVGGMRVGYIATVGVLP
ncbi:MAG TPA: GNAT family N-acetyltransferase, partial [Chloroflexia bacterium]|nr:GNAT family N-acetyltransferase [Chloroflexia bacterium]